MAMNAQRTVVGVFDARSGAEDAIEDLQNAGFSADQIYYSGLDEGHREHHDTAFWQGITRFFTHGAHETHEKTTLDDPLARQLKDMGLSDDEIRHYDDEYHNGRTLIAVNAPGREEEARAILRTNGAHD